MNSLGKWLVRGAALVLMLGFFLPAVTVSCTVLPGADQTLTSMQLASMDQGQPILFLLPFGALITLVLAFIPSNTRTLFFAFLAGQAAGLGLGLLGLLIGMYTFYSQMQALGEAVEVTPQVGLFALILGYGVAGVGIALQVMDGMRMGRAMPPPLSPEAGGAAYAPAHSPPPVTSAPSGARLEAVKGPLAGRAFQMKSNVFTIGRGPGNDLQLMEKSVSRQHARLRQGQGEWFLQDQQSSSGTRVNGKSVTATRLNSGDQVTIGDSVFVFRK